MQAENNKKQERSAGILLPITSLPSPFGVGDLGPEAKLFADFLKRSHQRYWQLLPLNPTEAEKGHSPYSAISSMAGNTLLISPEQLVEEGLLDQKDLSSYKIPSRARADYASALITKKSLLETAYDHYQSGEFPSLQQSFISFRQQEGYWLNDFACYSILKQYHNGVPWYQWSPAYKFRDYDSLNRFVNEHKASFERVQWNQFIFYRQWKSLKTYCNVSGIQLFGDLPFYVSYDSVDVWAMPEIFALDEKGNMTGVAGVPPDYFNEKGQRWGMPVFRWDVLKERHYDWWVQRIRKNMECYDLLRLDHFRALADYWEVPAEEDTAIHGRWKPGPGADFFRTLVEELGALPFVAEDLGQITDDVYRLRDNFRLPGMRVLHFAFGDNMPSSEYIPHHHIPNAIVYTGTHDNNTTRGWFRQNATKEDIARLRQYTGRKVRKRNVHEILCRMAYASVANTAMLPMQDVLGLDETARMNTPASTKNNWLWRLRPGELTASVEKKLSEWVRMYDRGIV